METTKWKKIIHKMVDPDVYMRYYRNKYSISKYSSGNQFLIDFEASSAEVFIEQIEQECWLFVVENKSKANNIYHLKGKSSNSNFYSFNIFTSDTKIGLKRKYETSWTNAAVVFFRPGDEREIFQRKNSTLRCCRIIFTANYLSRLTNLPERVIKHNFWSLKTEDNDGDTDREAKQCRNFFSEPLI